LIHIKVSTSAKTVLSNISYHLLGMLTAKKININEWYVEGKFEWPTAMRLVTLTER